MNLKYKFGHAEVIAMIVGSIIAVLIDILLRNNGIAYENEVRSLLIVIISSLFGAYTGVIVAVASTLLQAAILGLDVSLIFVIAFAIVGAWVGHYASEFGIRDGGFVSKNLVYFAMIKLMVEIFAWLFFLPLLQFLLTRNNLFEALYHNVRVVFILTLTDAIIIPIFMLLNDAFLKNKMKEK